MKRFLYLVSCGLVLVLTACSDLGYYVQCASGHWDVLRRCRPIDEVVADPSVPAAQRQRLAVLQEIRSFSITELGLPDNGSYRQFADIGRPYVVWNVVATSEFSLSPKQWCFPVAGCVAYRGYFDETEARQFAAQLETDGYEVDVYGVQAYSTLNWFDDPILNTFLTDTDLSLAALVFHELSHQVVYIPDDTRFNEAFAKTVEMEGVRRWLKSRSNQGEWGEFLVREQRVEQFVGLLMRTRGELESLYRSHMEPEQKRDVKHDIFRRLDQRYRELKHGWNGYDGFDGWFERRVNNARLASVATYRDLVPAFQALLASHDGDLERFYASVADIGKLSATERIARLNSYLPSYQARVFPEQDLPHTSSERHARQ